MLRQGQPVRRMRPAGKRSASAGSARRTVSGISRYSVLAAGIHPEQPVAEMTDEQSDGGRTADGFGITATAAGR